MTKKKFFFKKRQQKLKQILSNAIKIIKQKIVKYDFFKYLN